MSEAQKFQHIIDGIREDLTFVDNLYGKLHWILMNNPHLRNGFSYKKTALEIKEWTDDVFLDKIYEIDSKIHKFLIDVSSEKLYKNLSIHEIEKYIRDILKEKKGLGYGNTYMNLGKLDKAIGNYRDSINTTMDHVRKIHYKANWTNMKEINIEDYILPIKRHTYVTAREELGNAKQAIKDGKYEDVLNHLRPAIDLAIKERFGFKKVKMWQFLKDALTYNFPLPAYTMLYGYFDEGSQRLHSGRINTPYECQKALDFVNGFIDNLELIKISREEIDNFKKKCKWVE